METVARMRRFRALCREQGWRSGRVQSVREGVDRIWVKRFGAANNGRCVTVEFGPPTFPTDLTVDLYIDADEHVDSAIQSLSNYFAGLDAK